MKKGGFSLIEILTAMLIGSIVMMTLFYLYLNAKKAFFYQQEVLNLTEAARSAVILLSKAIKNAGDVSCLAEAMQKNIMPLVGYYQTKPDFLYNEKVMGNNVMQIRSCEGNVLRTKAYYIGDTKRKNKQKNIVFALYQKEEGAQRAELVTDIKNLIIWYGIVNATKEGIEYYEANRISDWHLVKTVKIAIELTSAIPVLTHSSMIYLPYSKKQYQDGYLHKEWLFNISLRNK